MRVDSSHPGGAALVEQLLYEPFRHDTSFQSRELRAADAKRRIGLAAAELVGEKDIIGLTTVKSYEIIPFWKVRILFAPAVWSYGTCVRSTGGGSRTGTVTDSTGAAVPNAKVVARDVDREPSGTPKPAVRVFTTSPK